MELISVWEGLNILLLHYDFYPSWQSFLSIKVVFSELTQHQHLDLQSSSSSLTSPLLTLTFHPAVNRILERQSKPIAPLASAEWKERKLFHMHLLCIRVWVFCYRESLLDSFEPCMCTGNTILTCALCRG